MKKLLLIISCLVSAHIMLAQDFYFVQITDTHLGFKKHSKKTEKIIESINSLPQDIKFVALTGDIFQNNLEDDNVVDQYLEFRDMFDDTLLVAPGNHDLLPWDYENLRNKYIDRVAPLNHIKNIDGVECVFFYSIPLADTVLFDYNDQKKWIENTLDSLKGSPVVIFHHQPSVTDFYNNSNHHSWPPVVLDYWTNLLNQYDVKAVITGHFHRDELHWLKNVPVYVASSIAGFWGRQASFRIYHYQKGKLSYQTVYLND